MADLLLHCGDKAVTRHEVEVSRTPQRTQTWVPIPHGDLMTRVRDTMTATGNLRIVNEAHALTPDGARYFGLFEVMNGNPHEDYRLVVGIRNSHDKRFPAGLVMGAAICVCDNLSFSGEVNIARKHTRYIRRDLPHMVEKAVGQLGALRHQQDRRIEVYKGTEMSHKDAHDLMIRSIDAQVLPASRIPKVMEEWQTPRHHEFAQDGHTSWRLFNAFTEAIKGKNLEMLPRRTQALHGLMDRYCGLN